MIIEWADIKIGDVLCIRAVDWGIYPDQHARETSFKTVKAKIYGEVIAFTDDKDGVVLSPQVFDEGDVRCTLVIPESTIRSVVRLINDKSTEE